MKGEGDDAKVLVTFRREECMGGAGVKKKAKEAKATGGGEETEEIKKPNSEMLEEITHEKVCCKLKSIDKYGKVVGSVVLVYGNACCCAVFIFHCFRGVGA